MISISHSAEHGTIIDGTSKGDGTPEILKSNGFRWSRNLGSWYLPRSRDQRPKMAVIDRTCEQLSNSGHTIEKTIDATLRPEAEVEADRSISDTARAARREVKVTRLNTLAAAQQAKANGYDRQLPPMGQPILVGHHSEARHRKTLDRARTWTLRTMETEQAAKEMAESAIVAATATTHRHNPVTVGNRIKTLQTELRALNSQLVATTTIYKDKAWAGGRATDLTEQIAAHEDKLAYWTGVRAEQINAGQVMDYSKDNISKGDLIHYLGDWYPVVRVNAKSVSIRQRPNHTWTQTVDYHKLTGHKPQA
ncbi:DUF3560 domain-containing protein [Specibacter sp. NPDC078692]|uniref:DUF3560 domain-containing protein n=1 Tax=Specibacter sp. NPDC078692 TaxID=3155818 RepID=UPI00341447E8